MSRKGQKPWLFLPAEVWTIILTHCDMGTLGNVRQTSKYMKTLVDMPIVWKKRKFSPHPRYARKVQLWKCCKLRSIRILNLQAVKNLTGNDYMQIFSHLQASLRELFVNYTIYKLDDEIATANAIMLYLNTLEINVYEVPIQYRRLHLPNFCHTVRKLSFVYISDYVAEDNLEVELNSVIGNQWSNIECLALNGKISVGFNVLKEILTLSNLNSLKLRTDHFLLLTDRDNSWLGRQSSKGLNVLAADVYHMEGLQHMISSLEILSTIESLTFIMSRNFHIVEGVPNDYPWCPSHITRKGMLKELILVQNSMCHEQTPSVFFTLTLMLSANWANNISRLWCTSELSRTEAKIIYKCFINVEILVFHSKKISSTKQAESDASEFIELFEIKVKKRVKRMKRLPKLRHLYELVFTNEYRVAPLMFPSRTERVDDIHTRVLYDYSFRASVFLPPMYSNMHKLIVPKPLRDEFLMFSI